MSLLIGLTAPDFTSPAVLPDGSITLDFNFAQYRADRPCALFFYALDYSFVCPTELLAIQNRMAQFEARGVAVVAVSIDSHLSHAAWRKIPPQYGGIGAVDFPLVSDITKQIVETYDLIVNDTYSLRGTFLLDKGGRVRHQMVNDFPLGRDIDHTLRLLDAMQFHEEYGQLCPAGWQPGKEGLTPTDAGIADYLTRHAATL